MVQADLRRRDFKESEIYLWSKLLKVELQVIIMKKKHSSFSASPSLILKERQSPSDKPGPATKPGPFL